jgi:hypothetical protein
MRLTLAAGVLGLAFVFGESDPETLMRVGYALHGSHGNLELHTTVAADTNGRYGADPI